MKAAFSIGDPNGIGAEVLLKALAVARSQSLPLQPHVFGPADYLGGLAAELGIDLDPLNFRVEEIGISGYTPAWGKITEEAGQVALGSLQAAAEACRQGRCELLVTAPVHKQALRLAGFEDPGQTEFLTRFFGAEETAMAFFSERLKVVLATVHIPLREVPEAISEQRIVAVGRLFRTALRRAGIERPRLAVCGLNPHASEGGLFGPEDQQVVAPAVSRLADDGPTDGPLPADTVFHSAMSGRYDGVIALYHDQGLVAVKSVAFDSAVNVTLGLPGGIRTSPDHGTAFDIAGQGRASEKSMLEAIRWGAKLVAGSW